MPTPSLRALFAGSALLLTGLLHAEDAWWNPDWTQRQKINVDSSGISAPVSGDPILIRLHGGNFQFTAAREDGSDIRFIAADGKTALPHQIESYDGLLNEAFVWVAIPEVKPGPNDPIYIYFGNTDAAMPAATGAETVFTGSSAAVYHFAGRGVPPADSSPNLNNSDTPATISDSSLIGGGLRLLGSAPVAIPASSSLEWRDTGDYTFSTWINPTALQPNAVIISRTEGESSLRLLLDEGIPVVEITGGSAPVRSGPGTPIPAATWTHLALVANAGKLQWYVNGAPYTTTAGTLPTLVNSPILIGGPEGGAGSLTSFVGELDELRISNIARPENSLKFDTIFQGTSDASQRAVVLNEIEGEVAGEQSHLLEHLSLFGDIAGNMMFDGWIAIGICALMIAVGWTVAIKKFLYLNTIEKGSKEFLKLWRTMSTDLTALDHRDKQSVSSMGGTLTPEQQKLINSSPLYHIYHIGSDEISNRLDKIDNKVEGLPGRSIQAIRASLDAGLVHETHRLTDGLVFLTISIAGGPYVGLLGTVVGVMITFAIIARSGEVNVNSIAPGIASALLATVVGLVVAIPALFIYSYLNGRIRNSLGIMQVFIDEFVAKMAEFYRPPVDTEPDSGKSGH